MIHQPKKILYLLLLVMISAGYTYAQEPIFRLSGTVKDFLYGMPVKGITVRLVGPSKRPAEAKTDSAGYYEFRPEQIKTKTTYTYFAVDPKLQSLSPTVYPGEKHILYIDSSQGSKDYQTDFSIGADDEYILSPDIYFRRNSSRPLAIESIDTLAKILRGNQRIELEIMGHCSYGEPNIDLLISERSELIKELLIKKGVKEERLLIKLYGTSLPNKTKDKVAIDKAFIDNISSPEEKESYLAKNRRISFRVRSWDYRD